MIELKWCLCYDLARCQHSYCSWCGARETRYGHTDDGSPTDSRCRRKLRLHKAPFDTCPKAGCRVPLSAHGEQAAIKHKYADAPDGRRLRIDRLLCRLELIPPDERDADWQRRTDRLSAAFARR